MSKRIKVGIIGASGYAGEELVRLTLSHPKIELIKISSRELKGKRLDEVYPNLINFSDLVFCNPEPKNFYDCDFIFFATPHGFSMNIVNQFLAKKIKIIDLSADFRLKDSAIWEQFYGSPHKSIELLEDSVYGLTELNAESISLANLVAVPGCYPTSILLALLPVLKSSSNILNIVSDSKSGITGAGRSNVEDYLGKDISNNFKAYGLKGHRHTAEINQLIKKESTNNIEFNFTPHMIPIMRGIYSTSYITLEEDEQDWQIVYESFYSNYKSVLVLEEDDVPELFKVNGTNSCHLSISSSDIKNQFIVISALDNLIKGASGQALQCFNLMCNFDIDLGLT